MRTAAEKQNYESHKASYNKRFLNAQFSPNTDSLLRDFWHHPFHRDSTSADSLKHVLQELLNLRLLNFYSEPDIQTRYTDENRFYANGMLIDAAGNIVIQTALKGIGEMRTFPVLTEKITKIDLETALKINKNAKAGDTLTLPALQMERTTLIGVSAVVHDTPEKKQLFAGQNILSTLKITFNHQFFKYAAVPSTTTPQFKPNLFFADAAYLSAHDGNGNMLLYRLNIEQPQSQTANEACNNFYMEDVYVEMNAAQSNTNLNDERFMTCGILGTDVFKNRKNVLDLQKGSLEIFPQKNILPNGIYAIAGTSKQNKNLNQSAIEVIERAPEFIRPGESHEPREMLVFTHDFVPLDLEAAPDEVDEEGETVAMRLYFSEAFTEKLERFTEDFTGGHIVLVIAGSAVTMQPVYGAVKNLKSVDVTRCTPAAARYLHLHLQNN